MFEHHVSFLEVHMLQAEVLWEWLAPWGSRPSAANHQHCQHRERSKRSTLATTTRCTGRRILSCGRREDDTPNLQLPPLVVSLEAHLSGTLGKKLGSSLAFLLSFLSFLFKIVNLFSEFPFFHVRQWGLEKSLEPMCGNASERSQIRHLLPVFGCLVPKGCGRQI